MQKLDSQYWRRAERDNLRRQQENKPSLLRRSDYKPIFGMAEYASRNLTTQSVAIRKEIRRNLNTLLATNVGYAAAASVPTVYGFYKIIEGLISS
jgi:hypothetical protein